MSHQKVTEELARGEHISIIQLVDSIIDHAESLHASDIHIDPCAERIRIRFRVDGILADMYELPKINLLEIVSRIKVLSRLRTDEHYATQDGRFQFTGLTSGKTVDIRVSIIPSYYGENVVLRLLSEKSEYFTLKNLGFSDSDSEKIVSALGKSSGMILVTGPTGSGKTTTLYTLLKMLHSAEVSIVTIEDPIEYAIDGIKQVQIHSRTGLTFANGLRSILRQDPNIIMVGEVRDNETAHIAVNTALTGHLLLSTLHTNDAATTVPRLFDMGVEPFLVASTLSISIGQRLVRKLCPHCRVPVSANFESGIGLMYKKFEMFDLSSVFRKGKGCASCTHTGFLGRMSINEVLVVGEDIREAIVRKASAPEIKSLSLQMGMRSMFDDGVEKVKQGLTTLEEVFRVIHE